MSSITIGDRQLHFVTRGAGAPLLWIHAFPLSGEMWAGQLDLPGVLHIVPDLPGFGRSDPFTKVSDPSIGAYGSDLLGLLDHLEISSAILAGCSMGGYIALDILRSAPERASAVILADTRETEDSPAARTGRADTIRKVEAAGSVDELVEGLLPKLLSSSSRLREPLVELVSSMIRSASVDGVVFALGAMARRRDSSEVLRALSQPVLILAGEEDQLIPADEAERMARFVPHTNLTIIPEAGHLPAIETPALFNDAISEFLSTHDLSS